MWQLAFVNPAEGETLRCLGASVEREEREILRTLIKFQDGIPIAIIEAARLVED